MTDHDNKARGVAAPRSRAPHYPRQRAARQRSRAIVAVVAPVHPPLLPCNAEDLGLIAPFLANPMLRLRRVQPDHRHGKHRRLPEDVLPVGGSVEGVAPRNREQR